MVSRPLPHCSLTLDSSPPHSSIFTLHSWPLPQVTALLVVSGPSGVGKGTLIQRLMSDHAQRFGFSTSHTTRGPRPGEEDGVHYHFVDKVRASGAVLPPGTASYLYVTVRQPLPPLRCMPATLHLLHLTPCNSRPYACYPTCAKSCAMGRPHPLMVPRAPPAMQAAMEAEIARGGFLEHAAVHGNLYGTSLRAVAAVCAGGRIPVLDIDVQGALQVL